MARNKINKDTVPQDFSLGLVLVDAIPVLFFCGSMIIIGTLISSIPFIIGAAACLWAGATKVIWKLIVVLRQKNIWWLFMQMRRVMPVGLLVMIIGLVAPHEGISGAEFVAAAMSMPAVLFLMLGLLGMCLMGFFAFRLDSSDVKANWIEQITNGVAQACIFAGLLLIALQ